MKKQASRISLLFLCLLAGAPLDARMQPMSMHQFMLSETIQQKRLKLTIEDTKTRVGFASVHLSVTDLMTTDEGLVGRYSIRVPLRKSKNDSGEIFFPLTVDHDKFPDRAVMLSGIATSDDKQRELGYIRCYLYPQKGRRVDLQVKSGDKTLKFSSNYTIAETEEMPRL